MVMEKILFVDDEPKILEAYRRTLRKAFKVVPASGAKEALKLMAKEGPFPVIVSDMQMPEINGVQLLGLVKRKYPDTVRIMLTGNADQKTAIDAINKSDVQKFLNKPCPPDKMTEAINEALIKYKNRRLEKELLESTVKASITTLVEVLSLAKPQVFGRAERIRDYARGCIRLLKLDNSWEIETLALLSQIGLISLPDSILERALKNLPMNDEQQSIYANHPRVAQSIIEKIPRLEPVAEAIGQLADQAYAKGFEESSLPRSVRLVRLLVDLTMAESSGLSPSEALSLIESKAKLYDPQMIEALKLVIRDQAKGRVVEINVNQLREGVELAKDIITSSGLLLIEKGQKVNASMIVRLNNFAHSKEIKERVCVLLPKEELPAK